VNGEVAAMAAAVPATLMNSLRLIGAIMALLVHRAKRYGSTEPFARPRYRAAEHSLPGVGALERQI
jgi:hypothetical protein